MAIRPTTHDMYSRCVQALLEPVDTNQDEWFEAYCSGHNLRFLKDFATVGITGSRQTGISSWFASAVIDDPSAVGLVLGDNDLTPIYSSRTFHGDLICPFNPTREEEDLRGLSHKLMMKFKAVPEVNGHVNQYHHAPDSESNIPLRFLNRGNHVKKIYILNARKFFDKIRHEKFYRWVASDATPELRIILIN